MELPRLAGTKEALEILEWNHKSMIRTYIKRGTQPPFPEAVQILACGPIWIAQHIEEFKAIRDSANREKGRK